MPNGSNAHSPAPIFVIGILGALVAGFGVARLDAVDLENVTATHVGEVFLTLIFVALLIERATEVYVNTSLEPDKQARLEGVHAAAANVRGARAALELERSSRAPRDTLLAAMEGTLTEALKKQDAAVEGSKSSLREVRNRISRNALIVAAMLGVLVAVAGIRALSPFLPGPPGSPGSVQEGLQDSLFAAVDVLVTGALLAGGADGLHKIVERFLQFAGKKNDLPLG